MQAEVCLSIPIIQVSQLCRSLGASNGKIYTAYAPAQKTPQEGNISKRIRKYKHYSVVAFASMEHTDPKSKVTAHESIVPSSGQMPPNSWLIVTVRFISLFPGHIVNPPQIRLEVFLPLVVGHDAREV